MSLRNLAGMALACLGLIVIAACSGGKAAAPEATPTQALSTGVKLETSLETTYYQVQGNTTEDIFQFIEDNGPTDGGGKRGSGLTSVVWAYDWSGKKDSDGSCRIASMTIKADMTVKLPQHADEKSLSPTLLQNWTDYAAGVAKHEQHHVDIYMQGARDIQSQMDEIGSLPSCDELQARIEDIWSSQQARINGLQTAFHQEEDQRLAAKRQPLEDQISTNRARLDSLQSYISARDKTISRLRDEIASLDSQISGIDSQIAQINAQFPNNLPENVRTRLEDLIRQSNDLLTVYNGKVDQHNTALRERESMATEYDGLLKTTNGLVDQFNWSR